MVAFRIGEITAHRYWVFSDKFNMLFSPHSYSGWKPGEVMEGRDTSQDAVGRKAMGCHAGVYSIKTREDMEDFLDEEYFKASMRARWWSEPYIKWAQPSGIVTGTVKIWGSVVPHDRGYRSEFSRIHSLETFTAGPQFETRHGPRCQQLANIRKIYAPDN